MWRASNRVCRRIIIVRSPWECPGHMILTAGQPYSSQTPGQSSTDPSKTPTSPKATPSPPPQPPSKQGGGIFFKLLGLTLVGGGGLVGYALYDKDFRKRIEDTVPYSKQGFDALFTYIPGSTSSPTSDQKQSLSIDPEEAKNLSLQKKKDVPAIEAPKTEDLKPTKAEIEAKKKEEENKKKQEEKLRKEEEKKREEEKKQREKDEAARKLHEQEMEEAAENEALTNILEVALREASIDVETAIALHLAAAQATRLHTDKLRQAMDIQGEEKENQWEEATAAFAAKSDTLAEAESTTEFARMNLEKIRGIISEGKANKVTKKNAALSAAEQKINSMNYDLKTAINLNNKAQSEAKVMSDYRNLVKKGREQFKKEVESLTPEVALNKKGGKLTEDDLNHLIAHAHRRVEQLQRQLAEQQALEELRVSAALEQQQEEDEKLAKTRVELERERMKADFAVVKDLWDAEARVNFERELRQQLSRQAAAHSDHLAEVLKLQETDLKAKYDVLITEKVNEERLKFEASVAGYIARLKGIETAVEARAELEQQGRKAQELWLACQMLYNVVQSGPELLENMDPQDYESYEKRMKPLLDEFMAILDASSDHPFVNSILETVPDAAVKRGIWTEKELQDRFMKVRKVCRRVAMLDETGGTLFRYFLSYFQSMFVFTTAKPLQDTDKVDMENLSTFSILDNARHYLEHGDLETALRFMNQLNGEPRRVAQDWISEARLLLETRQAADALLAHASSRGLGSLF